MGHPRPFRAALPPMWGWIFALVVLSLIPRVCIALKMHSVCPDGALYIQLADALEKGDLQGGLYEMRLNTYPAVLAALHHAGLDWELAGKLWGLAMACLMVPPLFGWVRRMFDDRVAVVACLLCAFHAKLILWTPELIRDPTFWMLFVSTLYFMWRAVIEVRLRWFVLAGLMFALAPITRFEGIFLLSPLMFWSFWRYRALEQGRGRLVLGTVLTLLVPPVLVVLVNVTWLRHHPQFEISRITPLELAHSWMRTMLGMGPGAIAEASPGFFGQPRMSLVELAWAFLHTGEAGLTPVYALVMFFGVWRWRHVWRRREHQPLFYMALAIVGGMWIHLWFAQASSTRYLVPIVLMGSMFTALGLLSIADWLAQRWARWSNVPPDRGRVAAALLGTLAATAMIGIAATNYHDRISEPQLGSWIRREIGHPPKLLGSEGVTMVISHYAQGQGQTFPLTAADDQIVAAVRRSRPDGVLLVLTRAMQRTNPRRYGELVTRIEPLGFSRVDPARLPAGCDRLVVLLRDRDRTPPVAEKPPAIEKRSATM